jgi:hypothetical protein
VLLILVLAIISAFARNREPASQPIKGTNGNNGHTHSHSESDEHTH